MEPCAPGVFQGGGRGVDVVPPHPGEGGDGHVPEIPVPGSRGDPCDGVHVSLGGGRKSRFEDIDSGFREPLGDIELLPRAEVDPRGLFPVAEGGVVDGNVCHDGTPER